MTVKENLSNSIIDSGVGLTINICLVKGKQSFIGIKEFEGTVVSAKLKSKTPTLLNPYDYFSKRIIEKEIIWTTRGDNEESYFVKDDPD